jgi:polysaccharide export outer membrane protein
MAASPRCQHSRQLTGVLSAWPSVLRVVGKSGWLLFVVAAGLAIAQTQPPPKNSNQPSPEVNTNPGLPTTPGVGQAVDPNKYSIGAEDVLYIQVWREPDFTRPVAVRPDGKITMPLIGEMQASGLTPVQLTKSLTDKLGTYVNHPDVTVTVMEVRSKKYYIDGLVNHPGEFPLVTPTRVLEALSKAGGFQEFANKSKVKILRGEGKQTFNFNYKDVSKGKHLEQNIFLENGDHVIVH